MTDSVYSHVQDLSTKVNMENLSPNAVVCVADLSLQESVGGLVRACQKEGYRANILVNCASIQRSHQCHEFRSEDWDEVSEKADIGCMRLKRYPGTSGSVCNLLG